MQQYAAYLQLRLPAAKSSNIIFHMYRFTRFRSIPPVNHGKKIGKKTNMIIMLRQM